MDGAYQDPSNWILDTVLNGVFRLGQAADGKISQEATGGWAPGTLVALLAWPKDWIKDPDTGVGYNT
eukprot:15185-Amphidinium_carterae.1